MQQKTNFTQVSEKPNFPQEEVQIIEYWKKINAFKKQLELTKDKPRFTFYDGPPFATGLPHYGHMCAGTIKDIVCRYYAQNDRYVERRFGWDCHGLPVEHEIDKLLNIKHRNQVLEMGIDKYNQECRSIVMKYSGDWRRIIERTGRWIDFDNDYKTLDTSFMESVWWVFKQLWDQGLVYRGCKVMPYSNGCSTVLSNFETQQNYKDVWDPALIVTFPTIKDPETKLIAWTTTPWTLPSNLALAVNPKHTYVKLLDKATKTHYIMGQTRISELYKDQTAYEVVSTFLGQELIGTEYVPIFNYFAEKKKNGCFQVLGADFVTDNSGTGIVHCAPGFGDDDYKMCVKAGIIDPADPGVPVDSSGRFTDVITDFKGVYVKDADKEIRKVLKANGRLIKDDQIQHNYPYCWRSDTPLIYKAVSCWFIKVTAIKENLVANNMKASWVPSSIQEGRFNNWLEDAQDWCFSRNRFWGNPIPIWVSEDYEEKVCIGSVEELRQLSGVQDIPDLHREHIDKITIPSKQGKGTLRRIEELFDCWFESGSMPYAQQHYPFENKEIFEQIFPADFIAEGIDQTRGWFYTLNVLSTALRNDTPYKHLIVNGTVLAENGEKMSKRLKNYPDPETAIMNVYGADAMRLYLINSGLVKAQSLYFKEKGVSEVLKNVFLPWYNAYRFLIQNIQRYESDVGQFTYDNTIVHKLDNIMDKWIISTSQSLIEFVRNEMEHYRLYTIVPSLVNFLEQLTNWYVRLNRMRFKGDVSNEDWNVSLNVLFDVLLTISILMSPYVPFITESFYQNMRNCIPEGRNQKESIHFLNIPELQKTLINQQIEQQVSKLQQIIECARQVRESNKLSLKQPVQSLLVLSSDPTVVESVKLFQKYIEDEINTPNVVVDQNADQYLLFQAEVDFKLAGPELGEKMSKDLIAQVKNFTQAQIHQLQNEGKIRLKVKVQREKVALQEEEPKDKKKSKKKVFEEFEVDCELLLRQTIIKKTFNSDKFKNQLFAQEQGFSLIVDPSQSEKLKQMGLAREFTNRIQKLRKKAGLLQDDKVIIFYKFPEQNALSKAVEAEFQMIQNQVRKPILAASELNCMLIRVKGGNEEYDIDGMKVQLTITKLGVVFNMAKLQEQYNENEVNLIVRTLGISNPKDTFEFSLDGKVISLGAQEYWIPK